MKSYVDKLPESCDQCELNCDLWCGATMNDITEENKKYCPLHSLKEVHNEKAVEYLKKQRDRLLSLRDLEISAVR